MMAWLAILGCGGGAVDEVEQQTGCHSIEMHPGYPNVGEDLLRFESFPGDDQVQNVTIQNQCTAGAMDLTVELSPPGPFILNRSELHLGPGEWGTVEVGFAPEGHGTWTSFLRVSNAVTSRDLILVGVSPDPRILPYRFMVYAWFGYDAERDLAVPFRWGGMDYPVHLQVRLMDERYFEDRDPHYSCDAILPTFEPQPLAAWAEGERVAFALDIPEEAEWGLDCELAEGGEAVLEGLRGVAVEPLHDAAAAFLASCMTDEQWEQMEPEILGAGYTWWGEYDATLYAYVYDADVDMVATMDEGWGVNLLAEEALADEPLAHGIYRVWTVTGILADH